jgi:hypothetical protein
MDFVVVRTNINKKKIVIFFRMLVLLFEKLRFHRLVAKKFMNSSKFSKDILKNDIKKERQNKKIKRKRNMYLIKKNRKMF